MSRNNRGVSVSVTPASGPWSAVRASRSVLRKNIFPAGRRPGVGLPTPRAAACAPARRRRYPYLYVLGGFFAGHILAASAAAVFLAGLKFPGAHVSSLEEETMRKPVLFSILLLLPLVRLRAATPADDV